MKEASGEANMTVITIVLIAIVLTVGTIIVRQMMGNTNASSCCQSNGGVWRNGTCFAECTASTGVDSCSGEVSTECDNMAE